MRQRFSIEDEEQVQEGESKLVGQVMRYRRDLDGYRLLNDLMVFHLRSGDVTSYRKTRHSVDRIDTTRVLDARVRRGFEDRVSLELCYLIKDGKVLPVWELRSHPPHLKYFDATTGEIIHGF